MILEYILIDLGFVNVSSSNWNLPDNPDTSNFNIYIVTGTIWEGFIIGLFKTNTTMDWVRLEYESKSEENILDATIKIMEYFNL